MSRAIQLLNLIESNELLNLIESDELLKSANKMVDAIEKKSDKTYSKEKREQLVQKFLKNMKTKTESKSDKTYSKENREQLAQKFLENMKEPTIKDAKYILEFVDRVEPFSIKCGGNGAGAYATTTYTFNIRRDGNWRFTQNFFCDKADQVMLNKARDLILFSNTPKEVLEGIKMLLSYNNSTVIRVVDL